VSAEGSRSEGAAEFAPERWEIAVEDTAEVIAFLLDRGQAAFDGFVGLWRSRPVLTAALVAAGAGAVIGTFVAGGRRGRPAIARSAVAQATAVAQAAAQRLAQQNPGAWPARALGVRDGLASARRRRPLASAGRGAQYTLQLVPVVVTLLKNPLVRGMLLRYAMRAVRR